MKRIVLMFFLIAIIAGCGSPSSNNSSTPSNSNPPETANPINCPQETLVDATLNQPITENNCPTQASNIVTITFSSDENNLYAELKTSSLYLFSYNFYLSYDPAILEFIEYQHGNFHGMSGNNTHLEIKEMSPDQGAAASVFKTCESPRKIIVFSHSRIGFSTSSLPGNITLGTLRFRKLSKSISQTDFIFKEIKTFEKYSNESVTESSVCWPQKIRLSLI